MTTLQDLAKEAYSYFELAERSNGDTYYRTKDTRPEWVYNLVFRGHNDGDYLPDDWRYRFIVYALVDLSDGAEEVESYPFFSNPDALDWLGTNLWRGGYCDEVLEEYGPIDSIWKIMIGGMEREYEEVFCLVKDFLDELEDDDEEEGEEEKPDYMYSRGLICYNTGSWQHPDDEDVYELRAAWRGHAITAHGANYDEAFADAIRQCRAIEKEGE